MRDTKGFNADPSSAIGFSERTLLAFELCRKVIASITLLLNQIYRKIDAKKMKVFNEITEISMSRARKSVVSNVEGLYTFFSSSVINCSPATEKSGSKQCQMSNILCREICAVKPRE